MTSTTDSKTSSKKTKDKHPLDDRVASGWPANPSGRTFDLPANNYHRDVYSDLITLISDEERISEKDFARLDTVMSIYHQSPQRLGMVYRKMMTTTG